MLDKLLGTECPFSRLRKRQTQPKKYQVKQLLLFNSNFATENSHFDKGKRSVKLWSEGKELCS